MSYEQRSTCLVDQEAHTTCDGLFCEPASHQVLVPHSQMLLLGNAQQQQHTLMQQLSQPQPLQKGVSPFGVLANQLDENGKPLARYSCPGLMVSAPYEEESEEEPGQLSGMLSSSWCDSSMSISRQSCSTASMRSLTSSPLPQHLLDQYTCSVNLDHVLQQVQHHQHQHTPYSQGLHQHQPHLLFEHQLLGHHHHQQLGQHEQHHQQQHQQEAVPQGPCSPCCSASSDFADACCCKVIGCSRGCSAGSLLSPSPSTSSCARAGSNSSTQSSTNTTCSDSTHCSSSGADAHAGCVQDAADTAAALLCRTVSCTSASSAWSNKSHHVASRPQPGGDLAHGHGLTWVMPEFGGREVLADYEFGQTLGCGTFGVTRLVTHRKTASLWACKTICKASIAASPAAQMDVQHEVAILQHLKGHNGIVQLKGVYEDERSIHLVMELCTGGDLLDYISRFQRLQESEAADVAAVMLSTLAHCHRLGIVHRDIKPENFLLGAPTLISAPAGTASGVLKISDFGVSAFYQPGERFTEIVGTPFYMAPEVLERCYGPEADVWSVGVVVFLMLAGRLPFDGATDRQIIKAVLDSEPDFDHPAWDGISTAAKDCVARMLVKDPRQRVTVQQLLAHPWLVNCVRSSCCSNAGEQDPGAGPAQGGSSCTSCSNSTCSDSTCAGAGCQQHGSNVPQQEPHSSSTAGSPTSSSKACGVSWASPCATDVTAATAGSCGSSASPRARRDSSPTPRKPLLSPLKHVRSRLGETQ